jgi:hypothetical protein
VGGPTTPTAAAGPIDAALEGNVSAAGLGSNVMSREETIAEMKQVPSTKVIINNSTRLDSGALMLELPS